MKTASVVDAAAALAPRVAELAAEGERQRRLPAELVEAFRSAGLFSMGVPAELGGGEVPVMEMVEAIETIARADAAAAWCVMIQATSGVLGAYLDPGPAAEIFGRGDAVLGGVYAPAGKADPTEGGYRVSGRWPFASGSSHCTWLCGGATIEGAAPRLMIFPAAEVEILDTWHVSGLAGTGSNDLQVTDVFVPAGRTVSLTGDRPRQAGQLYRFPVFGFLALGIAAVALGTARGAVDDLLELAGSKTPTGSRRKLAERPHTQASLAMAEANLAGARHFLRHAVGQSWAAAATGELDLGHRARLRLAATHATHASATVVDVMYGLGGGSSIYLKGTLQRRFRDVHAATQHMMVGQPTYELAGRALLGLEVGPAEL